MPQPDQTRFPLCDYFLSKYLSRNPDPKNFSPEDIVGAFERHEKLFACALSLLGLTREQLRSKSEFNFDSGDAANLEGGLAILRVAELLRLRSFAGISLVSPFKGLKAADLVGDKNGVRVCVEVKAVTKQSRGSDDLFFVDQLYEKIRGSTSNAAKQLGASAESLKCQLKILVYAINWFDQSIYLGESDYQQTMDRLERDGEVRSLQGIDGVWFVSMFGQDFLFPTNLRNLFLCHTTD